MRPLLALPVLSCLLVAQPAPQLVVSVGHSGEPTRAAFFGSHLATAGWSNVAIIDLSSGLTIRHLPQGSLVEAIEASPAGDLLAVGTCDHAIQLWDVKSWTLARRIALVQECAESLSFSPDGALLATGAYCCCSDEGLQVWDVRTGKLTRELAGGSGIRHVIFSGDGRWLAGVDDKGTASVFEWPSGRLLRTLGGLEGAGGSSSVGISSRDGRYLAWAGGGALQLWDLASGGQVTPRGLGRATMVTAAEFLSDGRLAYVDGDDMVVSRLPDGRKHLVSLPQAPMKMYGDVGIAMPHKWLRIRSDGLMLAGARESRTVVCDLRTSHLRQLAPGLVSPASLRWSRSGIVAWAEGASGLQGWDDRLGKPAALASGDDYAIGLAFRPDGARLAVLRALSVSVIDLARHRAVASRDIARNASKAVAFSPDGSELVLESSQALALFDANLELQRSIAALETYTSVDHVAFSPNARWIAAALVGPHPALRVWPADGSGSPITLDIQDVIYGPQPPAFSADSRWLASFVRGKSLTIWSTASWNVERTLVLPGEGQALAFAPNGSRLAVASDGEAAIWDAEAGRKLVTFASPGSAEMREIAWSPDGRRVVTSADDGVLRFWNAADGRLLASLYMLAAGGDWLLVAPDGRLDGSEWALAQLVAWRTGERIVRDRDLTRAHRVRDLWRSLTVPAAGL